MHSSGVTDRLLQQLVALDRGDAKFAALAAHFVVCMCASGEEAPLIQTCIIKRAERRTSLRCTCFRFAPNLDYGRLFRD